MIQFITFIADAATQPVAGETPIERMVIYAIGALVTIALAWIGYLHGRTTEQSKSIGRNSDRLHDIAVEATPVVPASVVINRPPGKGDEGGGTGSRVPRPTPMPLMPTGVATFVTGNPGAAQTTWTPTEGKNILD